MGSIFKHPIKNLKQHRHSTMHPISVIEEQRARDEQGMSKEMRERMERINEDFMRGFELVQEHTNTVAIFGSARLTEDNHYYRQAYELARRISSELGITIVTGGGFGIMKAANKGGSEGNGSSMGMTIELPYEHVKNRYVTHSSAFYYFFSRKVALAFAARAYIYFPGGFGTLDEFFEMLTLKQTGKIKPIPIIMVGTEFWQPLANFIDAKLKNEHQTISPEDVDLYTITDDFDEIIDIISKTKPRGEQEPLDISS